MKTKLKFIYRINQKNKKYYPEWYIINNFGMDGYNKFFNKDNTKVYFESKNKAKKYLKNIILNDVEISFKHDYILHIDF